MSIGLDLELARVREEYETAGLSMADLDADPIRQFEIWFGEATEAGVSQPNAMTLATVDGQGRPSARAVLLKGFGPSGFVFYTNLESRKAREMAGNPSVALCIVWLDLHRQVRIEGSVEPVDDRMADAYFASRPREARIAAAASPQSRPVPHRSALEALVEACRAGYGPGPIPRPAHWGGLLVRPQVIEFWQGRRHRLHDRIVYRAETSGWQRERLAP